MFDPVAASASPSEDSDPEPSSLEPPVSEPAGTSISEASADGSITVRAWSGVVPTEPEETPPANSLVISTARAADCF